MKVNNIRRHTVTLLKNINPIFISNDSSLFCLDGYNYFSFNFDYDKIGVSKLKDIVAYGGSSSIHVYFDKESYVQTVKYRDFSEYCKKYYNIGITCNNNEYYYNKLYQLNTIRDEHVYLIATRITKNNSDIHITMILNNKNLTHRPYDTTVLYAFECICCELVKFINEHYDCEKPKFTWNPIKRFKDIFYENNKEPLSEIFNKYSFTWQNSNIGNLIYNSKYCIINVDII